VENPVAAVLANLGALVSLCAFAPIPVIEEGCGRHARLKGEVADDARSDLFAGIGKTAPQAGMISAE
jgi:hypothetical protein